MAPEQGWGGEEREEREGEERRQWSRDGRSFWYEISRANKATNSRKSYYLEECLVHAFISLLAEEDVLVKKRKSSSLQACTYTIGHVVHQASLTRGSVAWSTYYGRFLLPPWNAWNGCKSSPRVPPAVMSQYPLIYTHGWSQRKWNKASCLWKHCNGEAFWVRGINHASKDVYCALIFMLKKSLKKCTL